MWNRRAWMLSAVVLAGSARARKAIAADPPSYTILLGGRTACVTPGHKGQARAEGGLTEIVNPSPNSIGFLMTGAVAANAYLGLAAEAKESFQLVQEFEINCSDPTISQVTLTVDSALVGFLHSRHKAGGSIQVASAKIFPVGGEQSPITICHPVQSVEGTAGKLCNQHLPLVVAKGMPLGQYVMTAEFVMKAGAVGVLDGHSAIDFSPSTTLPAQWVRTRDPFQGVDKKEFGFSLSLTATQSPITTVSAGAPRREVKASAIATSSPTLPPPVSRADYKGFERVMQPR